jgi:S-adenosylmethionine hydrolase
VVSAPLITFLSDYGYDDEFVGVCHGVIVGRCPQARVIDITHAIPAGDVRTGALVLADALAYMPAGVHLAVVDPGVGACGPMARAAVAVRPARAPQRLLVGPDNGLLALALERFGGALEAAEISASKERLEPLSRTFHGRDIFAPVAAALAAGAELEDVGDPFAPAALTELELPRAEYGGGGLVAHVLRADRFGNLVLDATPAEVEVMTGEGEAEVLLVTAAGGHRARTAGAFAEVPRGELLLYEDANGAVAIAVNGGSAAELLHAGAGGEILVRPL